MTDNKNFNLIDKNQELKIESKSCCSPDLTHKHGGHENHNGVDGHSHEHAHITEKNLGSQVSRFRIEAMDCPTEEALIRNKLGNMEMV